MIKQSLAFALVVFIATAAVAQDTPLAEIPPPFMAAPLTAAAPVIDGIIKLGRSDIVPAPWTPMQWGDDGFEVTGRTYTLGGEALLAQVNAAGEDLLAGPVRLEAETAAGVVTVTNVQRRPLPQSEAKGGWETTGSLGSAPVKLKTTAEFDGMMRFDLELLPAAPELVKSMRLVIPVKPERAIYYHHCSSYYACGSCRAVALSHCRTVALSINNI